jgi:prepilin-type N-terminal cleavage/methylation domain-containing protein/prepilin-type processing-associated H-X9-DG protein
MSRRTSHRHRGFTLVELLVVVAIIALLLAVLLPAMGSAQEVAKSVRCQANVRQLNVGLRMYAEDYSGRMMPLDTAEETGWYNLLVPYIGKSGYADDEQSESSIDKVGVCPKTKMPQKTISQNDYVPGNAFTAWIWMKDAGSYGMNDWMNPESDEYYNSPYNAIFTDTIRDNYFYATIHAPAYPAETPTVADCNWVGGWPREYDTVGGDLVRGGIGHGFGYFMRRFAIIRHMDRSINVGFVDGHVENVVLGDLWKLRWHRQWQPVEMDLP